MVPSYFMLKMVPRMALALSICDRLDVWVTHPLFVHFCWNFLKTLKAIMTELLFFLAQACLQTLQQKNENWKYEALDLLACVPVLGYSVQPQSPPGNRVYSIN